MRRKRNQPLMPTVNTNKEEQTIEYLKSAPDFFLKNPEILQYVEIPHESGPATSLVERQVSILRERNIDLRKRLKSLLETASTNDDTFEKMRSLTSAIIDVRNIHDLEEIIKQELIDSLNASQVIFIFENFELTANSTYFIDAASIQDTQLSNLIESTDSSCKVYRPEEYATLFQIEELNGPGSAALIPISVDKNRGVLIIGSTDPERFSQNLETLFLDYLSEIFSKILGRILP